MNKTVFFLTLILVLLPSLGIASSGAYEINQACVANGCFPGDSEGFPVQITQPGTYMLTGTLLVPDGVSGVQILASNVRLDLAGFEVRGPIACLESPPQCSEYQTAHTGIGVDTPYAGAHISNGSVRGFSGNGIWSGQSSKVEDISIMETGSAALVLGDFSLAKNVRIANATSGILSAEGSRVQGATINNIVGFALATDGSASDVSILNAVDGIYVWHGARLNEIHIRNVNWGIRIGNGATAIRNTTIINASVSGIHVEGGSSVPGSPHISTMENVMLISEHPGGRGINGEGPYLLIGANVCGDQVCAQP